jgi:DNA-binding MarR family transcriptional regulator
MSSDASLANETSRDSRDRELQVLEHIAQASVVRQRDIARIVGMSLGMTNSILKRLARKGFITIRKINNRNVMYAVSPRGFEQIARRSYRYLRRTIRNVVSYRQIIEALLSLIASQGFAEVVLIDDSDLDFIVDHACHDSGLRFRRARQSDLPDLKPQEEPDKPTAGPVHARLFVLYSERHEPAGGRRRLDDIERAIASGDYQAYLSELLI